MTIKIVLVAAASILMSANAFCASDSNSKHEESSIKEVRDDNPARLSEEKEYGKSDSASYDTDSTQNMTQGAAMQGQSQDQNNNIDIEGVTVVDSNGESIGTVANVVTKDREKAKDSEKMVVIGLSDSQKEVTVPMSDLTWENQQLAVDATQSELESREAIDRSYLIVLEPGEYNIYEFARFEKAESDK